MCVVFKGSRKPAGTNVPLGQRWPGPAWSEATGSEKTSQGSELDEPLTSGVSSLLPLPRLLSVGAGHNAEPGAG